MHHETQTEKSEQGKLFGSINCSKAASSSEEYCQSALRESDCCSHDQRPIVEVMQRSVREHEGDRDAGRTMAGSLGYFCTKVVSELSKLFS